MESLADYLNAARKRQGFKSDRALARSMEAHQMQMFRWRARLSLPTDSQMCKLAQLAGTDEVEALVLVNIWRTRGEVRDVYRRILRRWREEGGAVATVVAGLLIVSPTAMPESPGSSSVERTANNLTVKLPALYIMR
jgi:hypothetical protein